MEVRRALHAGSWYPRSKSDLTKDLSKYFMDKKFGPGIEPQTLNQDTRNIIGAVSPHAGHIYSGRCATFSYLNLFKEKIPDTIIIIGNDHIGYDKIALMKEGEWETPLGNLKIDSELAQKILDNSETITLDNSAFIGYPFGREHNIEIQLPFIKYCAKDKDVKIVPIKIASKFRDNYEVLEKISNDIAKSIKSFNKDIVIIASSDMSHEEVVSSSDVEKFKKRDQNLIDAFVELNPKKTFEVAYRSVCGKHTIVALMLTCQNLDAKTGKFLQYYTSFDITENLGYCVGYFSGIIIK
ncbi:MAG: AmmeMemoRadiSam system protein B [Candidatus Hodarchaeota archaeon]